MDEVTFFELKTHINDDDVPGFSAGRILVRGQYKDAEHFIVDDIRSLDGVDTEVLFDPDLDFLSESLQQSIAVYVERLVNDLDD